MTIPVFVLTGGPQGGKTSVLDSIRQQFADRVIVIPEAATTLLASYPMPGRDIERTNDWLINFQSAVIPVQLALESSWQKVAQDRNAQLLIADRGILDSLAYVSRHDGERIISRLTGLTIDQVHNRYAGVAHLESVATCAPEKFGKIGNAARYETLEEAVALEHSLRDAWKAHPNWNFVSGKEGVSSVIEQVIDWLENSLIELRLK